MADIDIKHAAGFLFAGALIGAAVALLYAPQSGDRTKKDIKRFARKTVDRIDDLKSDIRKLGEDGYEQVIQGFDSAKKCVEDGRSRVEHLIRTA